MASSTASQQPAQVWDESQCVAALAQLERLQAQIDDLRLTIPRVVAPLSPQITKRPELFAAFKKAAVGSQSNIKAFRTTWQSQETQALFEHTKASLEANSDLTPGAQLPRYGWEQKEIRDRDAEARRRDGAKDGEDKAVVSMSKEERERILQEFRAANGQLKVFSKDDDRDILIHFISGGLKYRFHVVVNSETNGGEHLDAECLGNGEPFVSITRCVSLRPHANELKPLLDMIAAYKNVQSNSCAKCGKLLDKSALVPTARRSKQPEEANEKQETVWEALHESCLD
ncbi:hypothetical protein BU24DRAFT_122744 [Aaosphaeria arxii CBS 175.79]|uniref:Uncharacterized protein n=1 Tax=Aaosphaeria arxii CBS 175.79 TaxID=1450172 RepID=A0A6A5Y1Y5_9PLEO|nr:uncharacterized protein BU24DRAFT_122744 [Aaosphaeria arxii CBS 175.79]KAF2019585.1 hypothetical protein BU24DRAFT_122744 [Aaosphaeria arxii CBS 175.79]